MSRHPNVHNALGIKIAIFSIKLMLMKNHSEQETKKFTKSSAFGSCCTYSNFRFIEWMSATNGSKNMGWQFQSRLDSSSHDIVLEQTFKAKKV